MSKEGTSRPADRLPALLAALDVDAADPCAGEAVWLLAATDQWRDALERARAAIHAGVGRSAMVAALADGALRSGRPERALKTIEQMAGRFPHVFAVSPADRALSLVRVRALIADGKAAAARRLAEKLLVRDPDHTALAALLNQVRDDAVGVSGADSLDSTTHVERLLAAGAHERARRVARRLALFLPDDAAVRGLLGALDAARTGDSVLPPLERGPTPAERGPR